VHILSQQLHQNQMAALSTPGTRFYTISDNEPSQYHHGDYLFKRNTNDIIFDYFIKELN
jgi:hypothetical protein